ncbi:MAG: U32 family peptidase [bacterium]|nr:U32 family peptidase [bacterium]
MNQKKIELLMPAGNMEKLKYAFAYGADAVYLGGKDFSLRARAHNFTDDEIVEAAKYAHELGKKVFVAVNAFTRTGEEEDLRAYLPKLSTVDALIIADPGVIRLVKEILPEMEIHLSTQANTTNASACKFWHDLGVSRIVLARELSIEETTDIVAKNPEMEFEIFVHGAICVAYSGRCFLSAYMTDRDANGGDCSQACRWKYKTYEIEEGMRPGEMMPYEEDEKGSYIFNANDMCQIDKIKELVESGVQSFKIEGRMKSLYYLVCITRIYREALDLYFESPEKYQAKLGTLLEEVNKLNNRGYSHGLYFGDPKPDDYNYKGEFDKITHYFLGQVVEVAAAGAKVIVKNNICVWDKLELLMPYELQKVSVKSIKSLKTNMDIEKASPGMEAFIEFQEDVKISPYALIRALG